MARNRVIRVKVGDRFGEWQVIALEADGKNVVCLCSCGTRRAVRIYKLVSGATKSCSCRQWGKPREAHSGTVALRQMAGPRVGLFHRYESSPFALGIDKISKVK